MYTMKQVCSITHLPYETLKFYCNEGLIPNVKRASNNYRVFDEHDLKWIQRLSCLKSCGMSIAKMKEYLLLCLQGEVTIPERMLLLDKYQMELQEKVDKLQKSIVYIDWKKQFYNDVLSGKTKYHSDLINIESE